MAWKSNDEGVPLMPGAAHPAGMPGGFPMPSAPEADPAAWKEAHIPEAAINAGLAGGAMPSAPGPSAPPATVDPAEVAKAMSENTNAGVRDSINFVAIGIPSELKISNPSTPHYRGGFCNLLVLGALAFTIAEAVMADSDPTPQVYNDDYNNHRNDPGSSSLLPVAGGVLGVVYLLYLIESCCSDSRKYMSNFKDVEGAEAFLGQMVDTPPDVAMTCECYHYETRYRTVTSTDSNGRTTTRTESYTVKVTTYRETDYFRYRAWKDESGPFHGMTLHAIVKLRLFKLVVWNDEASHRAFIMAYSAFQARNRWRDSHFSHNWDMRIRGFRTNVLALSDPTAKPCWLSSSCFCMFTLAGCSWPWRRMLTSTSVEAKFTFRKVILA